MAIPPRAHRTMRDMGDFQTPTGLVTAVLRRLAPVGSRWPRVLEPTCGRGRFLAGLLALDPPPREVHGVEIQPGYLAEARGLSESAPAGVRFGVTGGNLFALDLRQTPEWTARGPLLVVGNPPWVTSAALGAMGSDNLPDKTNVRHDRGLDAMTGASNFDLAEAVWLKLLKELGGGPEPVTIALLCKVSVARRVLEHAAKDGLAVESAWLARIDARAWFGASVEACLLSVTLGPGRGLDRVPVFDDLDAKEPRTAMGFARGRLVADLATYAPLAALDGTCRLVWRQGLKHDAAGVMELTAGKEPGTLVNKNDESVDVESEHIYPLLKGTDLARPGVDRASPGRSVLVTQRRVGDDTRGLAMTAPRLWAYLGRHDAAFAARKSSVYRGGPPYAMFGVGPYSFATWKVAVSGLHRAPVFRALGPAGHDRPVMLDDTCYFVPCRSPEQAGLIAALLNGSDAPALLRALAFPGAKRTVTKAALQRLDLAALLAGADRAALLQQAGAEVERLSDRPPDWPDRLEDLLEPDDTEIVEPRGTAATTKLS